MVLGTKRAPEKLTFSGSWTGPSGQVGRLKLPNSHRQNLNCLLYCLCAVRRFEPEPSSRVCSWSGWDLSLMWTDCLPDARESYATFCYALQPLPIHFPIKYSHMSAFCLPASDFILLFFFFSVNIRSVVEIRCSDPSFAQNVIGINFNLLTATELVTPRARPAFLHGNVPAPALGGQ